MRLAGGRRHDRRGTRLAGSIGFRDKSSASQPVDTARAAGVGSREMRLLRRKVDWRAVPGSAVRKRPAPSGKASVLRFGLKRLRCLVFQSLDLRLCFRVLASGGGRQAYTWSRSRQLLDVMRPAAADRPEMYRSRFGDR